METTDIGLEVTPSSAVVADTAEFSFQTETLGPGSPGVLKPSGNNDRTVNARVMLMGCGERKELPYELSLSQPSYFVLHKTPDTEGDFVELGYCIGSGRGNLIAPKWRSRGCTYYVFMGGTNKSHHSVCSSTQGFTLRFMHWTMSMLHCL